MNMNQKMNSNAKFIPGSFIEQDDLMGGRKISMVCDDGLTAIDNVDYNKSTPVYMHPNFKPVALGHLHEYMKRHSMDRHYANVVTLIISKDLGALYNDSLLMIRILAFIRKNYTESELTVDKYTNALTHCQKVQVELDDIHSCLLEYINSTKR